MRNARRRFLRSLMGGMAAVCGLLPGKAWGWGGRRRCSGPPVSPCWIPLPGGPECPGTQIVPGPYFYDAGVVNPDYPPAAGGISIPGGGGFCVWGTATNMNLMLLAAEVVDPTTGAQLPNGAGTALGFSISPCNWAFVFQNVGPKTGGTNFKLHVYGPDSNGTTQHLYVPNLSTTAVY
jgi:hypothetical protein